MTQQIEYFVTPDTSVEAAAIVVRCGGIEHRTLLRDVHTFVAGLRVACKLTNQLEPRQIEAPKPKPPGWWAPGRAHS